MRIARCSPKQVPHNYKPGGRADDKYRLRAGRRILVQAVGEVLDLAQIRGEEVRRLGPL